MLNKIRLAAVAAVMLIAVAFAAAPDAVLAQGQPQAPAAPAAPAAAAPAATVRGLPQSSLSRRPTRRSDCRLLNFLTLTKCPIGIDHKIRMQASSLN